MPRSLAAQLHLYARCSAGTHAEVTIDEARFIFLQTYIVLGEILTLSAPQYDDSGSQLPCSARRGHPAAGHGRTPGAARHRGPCAVRGPRARRPQFPAPADDAPRQGASDVDLLIVDSAWTVAA
ncbi:hypothetical protein ACFVY1_43625 [Streptomyces sp. NPDC058293]|uniref:hypothetical protein n=1 Tax=Streptomyces sp. NPDC058293 TaxID=3346429 RepID=UPI0036E76E74